MSTVRAKFAGGGISYNREQIIIALQEYAERYGDTFTTASFNPATARWRDREELVERYYAGRLDGSPWPSLNQIKSRFDGSFNAARRAAGLAPNRPGPHRRGKGEHAPIRDVRIERIVVRTVYEDDAIQRRLDRAIARAERAERLLAAAKPPKTVTKTVVKTRTVTKRDERAVERVRVRAEDEKTRRVAAEDQVGAAVRDRDSALRLVEKRAGQLASALAEAKNHEQEAKRLRDRLEVAERRVAEVRDAAAEREVAEARTRSEAVKAAAIADRVRDADRRADRAELRAARAERELVEQAQAITGQKRKLTVDELKELRKNGPAGPAVLAAALKKLGKARAANSRAREIEALTEVASAALMMKDRL